MEILEVLFPVSGVRTNVLVPPLVAMAISFFTSMGGVSGAFLILPFQMSVLGYTAPSVSATNFVYNIAAIPSGVYRYMREGRMAWPLTWVIALGTLPGVFLGYYIRVLYLPEPEAFKVFVGAVLLYIGARLLYGLRKGAGRPGGREAAPVGGLRTVSAGLARVEFEMAGGRHSFATLPMFALAFVVGAIGGAYGIGGGAIIAPFCVTVFNLPIHAVAGAALMATFITSLAGVAFYSAIPSGLDTAPDWALGLLFGAGGFVGMYLGARAQKHVPQRLIKLMLGLAILFLAARYISPAF
ncbi:MAG: sulfite exporter TauE/SafE family protein [Thermodesulfovibrionales bacterium]